MEKTVNQKAWFLVLPVLVLVASAVLLALSVWLVAQMGDRVVERSAPVSVAGDVVDGVRWLWSNRPVRTLTLTILVFNDNIKLRDFLC